jgi:hypothetical protein
MQRQVNLYDGIQSVYTCATCKELMEKFSDNFIDDAEDMFPGGCVSEAMSQTFEFIGTTPEQFLKYLNAQT